MTLPPLNRPTPSSNVDTMPAVVDSQGRAGAEDRILPAGDVAGALVLVTVPPASMSTP